MWGECEALSVESYKPQVSWDMCKSVPLKYYNQFALNLNASLHTRPTVENGTTAKKLNACNNLFGSFDDWQSNGPEVKFVLPLFPPPLSPPFILFISYQNFFMATIMVTRLTREDRLNT